MEEKHQKSGIKWLAVCALLTASIIGLIEREHLCVPEVNDA